MVLSPWGRPHQTAAPAPPRGALLQGHSCTWGAGDGEAGPPLGNGRVRLNLGPNPASLPQARDNWVIKGPTITSQRLEKRSISARGHSAGVQALTAFSSARTLPVTETWDCRSWEVSVSLPRTHIHTLEGQLRCCGHQARPTQRLP